MSCYMIVLSPALARLEVIKVLMLHFQGLLNCLPSSIRIL